MSEVKLWVFDPCNLPVATPATADEIRAGHAKCETCEHKFDLFDSCSLGILEQLEPSLDYCRHHTPREGAEGREGAQG